MNSNPLRPQYGRRASHAVREADKRAAIHGRLATEEAMTAANIADDRRQRLPITARNSTPFSCSEPAAHSEARRGTRVTRNEFPALRAAVAACGSPGREATWCQGEAVNGVEVPATDESRFVEPESGPGLTAARRCTYSRALSPIPAQHFAPGARWDAGERTGAIVAAVIAVSTRNTVHQHSDSRCLYLVHDGRKIKVAPVVDPAVRYLDARGMLERDAGAEHLVRVVDCNVGVVTAGAQP
jgi:hypothetical protein